MSVVVVAGATGYLGRHLVEALAERGHHVRALARAGKAVPHAQEVLHVDVLDPATLVGVCDGADAVFSALGITRQTDAVTYEDIEFTANLHLLHEARSAGVPRFGVISVVNPEALEGLAITASRERFVAALRDTPVSSLVVRATGFFSDLEEVLEMARSGRVWLVGDGTRRINPVHGRDLADAIAEGLFTTAETLQVGGPEVFTHNAIADLAFEVLGRPPRVTHVPTWMARLALGVVRLFHRRTYDIGSFIVQGAQQDMLGEVRGHQSLRSFYEERREHTP